MSGRRLYPSLFALMAALLSACQSSAPAAPTAPAQARPTSIARTPGAGATGWTTPAQSEAPATSGRERRARPGRGAGPQALASSPSDPTFSGVGTGVERRLERDVAQGGPWELFFTTTSTYVVGGRLSNGQDGVDLWTNRIRASLEKPLPYFGRFGVNATYAAHTYFFSGPNALVAGTDDPFDLVHTVQLGTNVFQPVSESWAVVASADVSASAADGADLLDAVSWSVTLGGGHRLSSKLDVGAGLFVAGRFEEDLIVFGGPQFDWRPHEQWRFALQGAQLDASFRPNEQWEWGLTGGFTSNRFRLPDDPPGLSQIVTDTRLPIYLRLRWIGDEKTDLEFRVGMDVYRDLVVEDARGENSRGVTGDPAPFIGVRWIQRL